MDLAALPESVKRRILGLVLESGSPSPGGAGPASAPQQVAQRPELAPVSGDAQPTGSTGCHASWRSQLPDLRSGLAVVDGFLAEVASARACAEAALAEAGTQAGMGGRDRVMNWRDSASRGDRTRWLQPAEEEAAGRVALAALLRKLRDLQAELMARGHDVGGKTTFQLACYPGEGARYVRHADASPSCPTRRVTAIVYLNSPSWEESAGGQLVVYNAPHVVLQASSSSDAPAAPLPLGTPVAPLPGRLVLFASDIEHEVLPVQAPRWAVTAWFHCAQGLPAAAAPTLPAAAADHWGRLVPPAPAPCMEPHPSSWCDSSSSSSGQAAAGAGNGLIFVSIISYRDPETPWTLADMFAQADHPSRVRAGVVWQLALPQDSKLQRVAGKEGDAWQAQVRSMVLPAHEANGPCRPRALAAALWSGEEYCLQIDAHMRFVRGWDSALVAQLHAAEALSPGGKAVLSTYPLGYEGAGAAGAAPDPTSRPPLLLLCAKEFDASGLLRVHSRALKQPAAASSSSGQVGGTAVQGSSAASLASSPACAPLPSLFWAAGFSFSRFSLLLHHAPYCPLLPHLFFGEEAYMLARLWTAGYDVWAPGLPLLAHQWERAQRGHSYQADMQAAGRWQEAMEARARSQAAVLSVLRGCCQHCCDKQAASADAAVGSWRHFDDGYCPHVPPDWRPGGRWGLGTARSLAAFQEHCGVDFRARAISQRARLGGRGGDGDFE